MTIKRFCMWWLSLLSLCGCAGTLDLPASSSESNEPSFAQQVQRVVAHESDEIRLLETKVDAKQLQSLLNLGTLRTLILDAGVVTDKEIPLLADLKALTHLRLRHSRLTDVGLKDLAKLRLSELQVLNLPQASVTALGLKELAVLPKLKQLRLAGNKIDDAAIVELSKFPALESLHLIRPGITEAALDTFVHMPELSTLYVDEAQVSDTAWDKLQIARPKLHLHLNQVHDDLLDISDRADKT